MTERGRMRMAVFAAAALAAAAAGAQSFYVNGREIGGGRASSRRARGAAFRPAADVKISPDRAVVAGEPFSLEFSVTVPENATMENISLSGLPQESDGFTVLRQENLPDAKADGSGVKKRFRIVMRPDRPDVKGRMLRFAIDGTVTSAEPVSIAGSFGTTYSSINGRESYGANVRIDAGTVELKVDPLPEKGRPDAFSGAVGTRFALSSRFEEPDAGWPGTWSTAVYALDYDGWFPTNAAPRVHGFEKAFENVHPMRETSRGPHRVEWRQTMMPRGLSSTNGPAAGIVFYNTRTRRYEVARCAGAPLAFKRPPAPPEPPPEIGLSREDGRKGVPLRFAPGARSPVTGTVPPGETPVVLERKGAWRRVRTSSGTGWIR